MISAWTTTVSASLTLAEWSTALLNAAPESSLLIVWGVLLLAAGQSVRAHRSSDARESTELLGVPSHPTQVAG